MSIDTVRGGLNWNLSNTSSLEYNFAYADQRRSQQTDDDAGYHRISSDVDAFWDPVHGLQPGKWPVADNSSITLNSKYLSLVQELQYKQKTDTLQYVVGGFLMREKNAIQYSQEMLSNDGYGLPMSQFYDQPDRQIESKALFAQADWKFAPTWTLTVGGRYSWDSKTDKGGRNYGGWDSSTANYYNGLYDPGTPGTPEFRPHNSSQLTNGMGAFVGPSAYKLWGDGVSNDHSESWGKFTYRLGLMNQITPKDMVYGSLSTGYKAGGFGDNDDRCGGYTCADGSTNQRSFFPYKPETVTNLELGYKGLMLNNRLSLSATAFFSRYQDMQVTGNFFAANIVPPEGCHDVSCSTYSPYQTINVGTVDIPGLELEFDYKPWSGARLGGFFTYIDSKVKNYPNYSDGWMCDFRTEMGAVACPDFYSGSDPTLAGLRVLNVTGHHLPFSPKFSLGLNFSQTFNFGEGYSLTPWISWKWQDKMYFTLRNLDNAHISDAQKAYSKIDASIKLVAPKNWYAEAYVYNLSNTKSMNSAQAANGFIRGTWNDPRMYGVRIGIDY
ncbi:TonB-dependent receptor [Paucibacter sp. Y2R2-4]|nr:TonB-dependent receptor [Paucibacter sp. Y2R2-4]